MQTLVYENYSKFIDATDAIKSIGTNVASAGNHGLDRLKLAMGRIQASSVRSEELLRESREAVAEKLRIQRLLTRLDALLCLPSTLRGFIGRGKYRMAVQSHASATEILGRHSAGFESLRSIELECGEILRGMSKDLRGRLVWWSGSGGRAILAATAGSDGGEEFGLYEEADILAPQSIAEIFECAGTLLMLQNTLFSPGLDRSQCQSLALEACGQFLKERLEPPTTSSSVPLSPGKSFSPPTSPINKQPNTTGIDGIVSQLPLAFLDGILESTTLYGVSFPRDASTDVASREFLSKFVSENFDKFIAHVRMILIQRSEPFLKKSCPSPMSKNNNLQQDVEEEEESKDDANFFQISLALAHLLRSVRELASGLALPEVGLDVSLASMLVDQSVELTEMLVRRRVAMKFYGLREVVVKECLTPLVREVVRSGHGDAGECKSTSGEEKDEDNSDNASSTSLVDIVQLANVALSDGLQMADDLIRATLQRSQLPGANTGVVAPVDSAVVKLAVQKNARLFGVWLASSLEQLVGCEPSDYDQVLLEVVEEDSEDVTSGRKRIVMPQLESEEDDYLLKNPLNVNSFSSKDSSSISCKVEATRLLSNLIYQLDDEASDQAYSDFLIAICEMCRLAERSIANTMNQSIQSAMEEESRVADSANTLFATNINPHRKGKDVLDADNILARRFQLAASRALAMYMMNRGAYAASELCANIYCLSDARDPYAIPSRPREECLKLFEIIKASCVDCISIVGGDLFAAPVAPFPEADALYADVFGSRLTQHSSGGAGGAGAPRGLQLDVERMFIEKIQMYPHSLDQLDFTRNSVVSGILRVALSSFFECVRSSVFSSLGYRQLKVDAIFLRYLIPHFVKDEFGTPDANACTCLYNTIDDIMFKAGQRCVDPEVVGDDEYYDAEKDEIVTPFGIVHLFLLTGHGSDGQDDVESGDGESLMKRISFS